MSVKIGNIKRILHLRCLSIQRSLLMVYFIIMMREDRGTYILRGLGEISLGRRHCRGSGLTGSANPLVPTSAPIICGLYLLCARFKARNRAVTYAGTCQRCALSYPLAACCHYLELKEPYCSLKARTSSAECHTCSASFKQDVTSDSALECGRRWGYKFFLLVT